MDWLLERCRMLFVLCVVILFFEVVIWILGGLVRLVISSFVVIGISVRKC